MGILHETSREVVSTDFVGKTVATVKQRAANVVAFTFTDGGYLELWCEVCRGVPCIEVDPKATPDRDTEED